MKNLSKDFYVHLDNTVNSVKKIKGHLPKRDLYSLCVLGMLPTTKGDILEIGSFRGKSTVALAKSVQYFNKNEKVYAVDPFILDSETDPSYKQATPIYDEFQNNLKTNEVDSQVKFFNMKSSELGQIWDRKIRLLWIDGDHTYSGAKVDLETFLPYLNPGAIVAFHDVLNSFEGPVRVVVEQILLSDKFGSFGFCGSIGWAQYLGESSGANDHLKEKMKFYKKLNRLVPFVALKPREIKKSFRYKLFRSLIPHDQIEPSEWIKKVKFMI